jgi:FkbM family methyltransferase
MTPDGLDAGLEEALRLPRESLRDLWNDFRQDFKYRVLPFRAFYRFRAYFYARSRYPELKLIKNLADRGKIGLDVGANLGLYTYFLARACRHVYAFEPNPNPLRALRAVADANVTVLAVALSDKSGEADLAIPRGRRGWSNNGATISHGFPGRSLTLKVPCRRIDDLGLDGIGIIKVDVEGFEKEVLLGARETLKRDRPVLLVENEIAHVGGKFAEVFELLASLGYRGFFLDAGVLRTLSHFSVHDHQVEPLKPGGDRRRYVRNFIFLPG